MWNERPLYTDASSRSGGIRGGMSTASDVHAKTFQGSWASPRGVIRTHFKTSVMTYVVCPTKASCPLSASPGLLQRNC